MIISIDGNFARVSAGGAILEAGLHMIENPRVGDYILLHAGFAIQKISEEEARETLDLLKELNDTQNI
jgi:hydrogenase expression/formation protein HypC